MLFLCTGNSCRRQMAEGWSGYLKADVIHSFSAGIEKHGLDLPAVQVMAEAGVDIRRHESKVVADRPTRDFDSLVMVCGHYRRIRREVRAIMETPTDARERELPRPTWRI